MLRLNVQGLLGQASPVASTDDLWARQAQATAVHRHAMAQRADGAIGFWNLPDDEAMVSACEAVVANVDAAIDTVVVLGIGGSSLGPKALYSALGAPVDLLRQPSAAARRLVFADNVDPVTFSALLERAVPQRTLWLVITKSGGTAETAAQLLLVEAWLTRHVGAAALARHMVFVTDPTKGALRKTAARLGVPCLDLPSSVGGRFSVLSAVGLLPAALAGLDIRGLMRGAKAMRDRLLEPGLAQNPGLALAALLAAHDLEGHRPMVVMMSYADGLYDIADWFRQLWAESLGKARARDGRVVHRGPTPIAARGATDQHSQLQLYAEGPDDKAYVFLSVAARATDLVIPTTELAQSQDDYRYLAGKTMGALLDAELRGTMASLAAAGRPLAQLELEGQTAPAVGTTLMLLEGATAFAGGFYDVDPFDQPGVEDAKRRAFAALGRPGYDAFAVHSGESHEGVRYDV